MGEEAVGWLAELAEDDRTGTGSAFELDRRGDTDDWLLRMWGSFPPGWVGNLALHCAGARVSLLEGEARKLAGNRWIAFFGLHAANAVAQPPALDFVRMAIRRPALPISDADVVLEEVSARLRGDLGNRQIAVRIAGPDRLGLLAFLLTRFEEFGLHPVGLQVNTREGRAHDSFLLAKTEGPPPTAATVRDLERSLRSLCRPL